MRGAVTVRRLELVANVAIRRERQSLLGYRRAADVAAQSFEFLAFIGPGRHPGMQAKPSHFACPVIKQLVTR